jgi:hypothetical protein
VEVPLVAIGLRGLGPFEQRGALFDALILCRAGRDLYACVILTLRKIVRSGPRGEIRIARQLILLAYADLRTRRRSGLAGKEFIVAPRQIGLALLFHVPRGPPIPLPERISAQVARINLVVVHDHLH